MAKPKEKNDYGIGDVVLLRGRITRKTEDVNQKTIYRISMIGIGSELDMNESAIAGITTEIPNGQDEE